MRCIEVYKAKKTKKKHSSDPTLTLTLAIKLLIYAGLWSNRVNLVCTPCTPFSHFQSMIMCREVSSDDQCFSSGPWVAMLDDLDMNGELAISIKPGSQYDAGAYVAYEL